MCGICCYTLVHSQVQNWQQLRQDQSIMTYLSVKTFFPSQIIGILPICNYKEGPEAGFKTGSDCKHLVGRHCVLLTILL